MSCLQRAVYVTVYILRLRLCLNKAVLGFTVLSLFVYSQDKVSGYRNHSIGQFVFTISILSFIIRLFTQIRRYTTALTVLHVYCICLLSVHYLRFHVCCIVRVDLKMTGVKFLDT